MLDELLAAYHAANSHTNTLRAALQQAEEAERAAREALDAHRRAVCPHGAHAVHGTTYCLDCGTDIAAIASARRREAAADTHAASVRARFSKEET